MRLAPSTSRPAGDPFSRLVSRLALALASALALLGAPAVLAAQERAPARDSVREAEADVERLVKRARTGGGLRVGGWLASGLTEVDGVRYSTTPAAEGVYTKGLDKHLVLEHSVGFWRRSQEIVTSGGLGGGTTTERVQSYVVPQFTGLTLFPFTEAGDRLEPYVNAGVGVSLGIDDRQTSDGSLLGGSGGGTAFVVGFGAKGGLGVDLRLTRAFGATIGGRYQWIRFLEELGGERTYRGAVIDGGLTYRFQF